MTVTRPRTLARGYARLLQQGDADLLAQDEAVRAAYAELLAATLPVTPAAAEPYLGRYEGGVSVSQHGGFLRLRSVYGELPSFLAVPEYEGVFINVGNVLTQVVAQFTENELGEPTLAIGVPDFATGELIQRIELSKLERRHGPRRHPADVRRLWGKHRPAPWGVR